MNDFSDLTGAASDLQACLSAADDACRRGSLNEALQLWTDARRRYPDSLPAALKPALALREAGRRIEAESILAGATERFPGEVEAIRLFALLAQEVGENGEAVRRFAILLDRFPAHRDGYMRIVGALRDLGRFSEAEERLAAAMGIFPDEPWFAAQYGWTALARKDTGAAGARFAACRGRFPEYADGWLGTAFALRGGGSLQEADDLLAESILRFPRVPAITFGYADHALWMRTAGLLTWDETLQRWEALRQIFPDYHRGYLEGIRALVYAGRAEAAEALAIEAVERFPDDARLADELARRAEDRQDWPELIRRFQRMTEVFPDRPAGYAGHGRALSLVGHHHEAGAVLSAAMARFPDDPGLATEYAMAAERCGDWPVAAARWDDAHQRFPDRRDIAHHRVQAGLRLIDLENIVQPADTRNVFASAA
jgi:tetratricopeptide (TPR) repeat protein